jgi:hypothetical protein
LNYEVRLKLRTTVLAALILLLRRSMVLYFIQYYFYPVEFGDLIDRRVQVASSSEFRSSDRRWILHFVIFTSKQLFVLFCFVLFSRRCERGRFHRRGRWIHGRVLRSCRHFPLGPWNVQRRVRHPDSFWSEGSS